MGTAYPNDYDVFPEVGPKSPFNKGETASWVLHTNEGDAIEQLEHLVGSLTDPDPDTLVNRVNNVERRVVLLGVQNPLIAGLGKATFRVSNVLEGMELVEVAAHVTTPSGVGQIEIQIRNVDDAVSLLSTTLTIDALERDSITASVPAVINGAVNSVSEADELLIDVVQAGSGASGLTVELIFS